MSVRTCVHTRPLRPAYRHCVVLQGLVCWPANGTQGAVIVGHAFACRAPGVAAGVPATGNEPANGAAPPQRIQWRVEAPQAQRARGRHRGGTMVAYDFKCKKCGKQFEVTCHMDERKDKAVCPKCGSHKVKQKLTAAFSSPPPAKY